MRLILCTIIAISLSGCASVPQRVESAPTDGVRLDPKMPLVVDHLENNFYGQSGSHPGTFVAIGFTNTSQRVMDQVTFYLALYDHGVPVSFDLPNQSPLEISVQGSFEPGEHYSFRTLHAVANIAHPSVDCAQIVGIDVSFEHGKTIHIGNSSVAEHFTAAVPRYCWANHPPVIDAATDARDGRAQN